MHAAPPAACKLALSIDEEMGYGSARSRVTTCGGQGRAGRCGSTLMNRSQPGSTAGAQPSYMQLPTAAARRKVRPLQAAQLLVHR